MRTLRVAMAQINTTVGDLEGNAARIRAAIDAARDHDAGLVAFPELALPGYPPEDLLLKPQFIRDNIAQLHGIVAHTRGITAVVGFVDAQDDLFNAAAVIHDRELVGIYHKMYLPNYGVFDEDRYFLPGRQPQVYTINGIGIGVNICEDIWYPSGPTGLQAAAGAELIININGSPYQAGKLHFRETMLATRATDYAVAIVYTNLVGGQDELVFDGGSFAMNAAGEIMARGRQFEEDLVLVDFDAEAVFRTRLHDPRRRKEKAMRTEPASAAVMTRVVSQLGSVHERKPLPPRAVAPKGRVEEVYDALVLGTRDYVRKNGFSRVVIGLSGGIDSALTAAVAVDALGRENVIGVGMPSRYSSEGSVSDSRRLAENLGIEFMIIPIEEPFAAFLHTLEGPFAGLEPGLAEENLQARIRGMILLTLSNKFGWLVLTTGNKSEMATGYSTLAGDMAGGFAVIKDVPKTLVYDLCNFRNARGPAVIPQEIIVKPPSAELRPDQLDSDSLPAYEALDPIIRAYVEEDRSYEEMLSLGFDEATVQRVMTMVDRNEYKRRQAPPGVKITPRAFGRDRRLPIVNKYRSY